MPHLQGLFRKEKLTTFFLIKKVYYLMVLWIYFMFLNFLAFFLFCISLHLD